MSLMRYWFSATLVTTSPLHSSGLDEEVDRTPDFDQERTAVPRSFSRTVDGIPSLSGRSVKGALRSAMTRCFPSEEERFKPLWGSLDAASPLTIHPIALSDVCTGENLLLRDGIAVDRYWGTAGHGALFQHEVAPAGVPLLLSISAQASSRPDIEGGVSPHRRGSIPPTRRGFLRVSQRPSRHGPSCFWRQTLSRLGAREAQG